MKTLSVRQPWAWAIAKGYKPVENRTWSTQYRGPLAIHAGQRWDDDNSMEAWRFVVHTLREQGVEPPRNGIRHDPLAGTGLVVAVVDLVDVCGDGVHGICECGPLGGAT